MQGKRVFGLDALRATAISLVVASHCSYMFSESTDSPILMAIRSLGAIGVDLFFVLSGYLIGGILLNQVEKNRTNFRDLFWFWKRRWFRTLPNYYLILLINITIVLIAGENLPNKLLLYFPFLQNFLGSHPDFFTEAWSLSIEEYSYLILPLSLYFGFAIF
ncbi:MAG TPA: acyltransferase, partial [Flavobacteriaceae bacterium]|nr:acyltransferase [Flavobacteriaceae bacterium]